MSGVNYLSYRDLTPAHMRAARGLLGWSQTKLSEESGVALSTIKRIELSGTGKTAISNVDKIANALQRHGIQFENGGNPGARLYPGEDFSSDE